MIPQSLKSEGLNLDSVRTVPATITQPHGNRCSRAPAQFVRLFMKWGPQNAPAYSKQRVQNFVVTPQQNQH